MKLRKVKPTDIKLRDMAIVDVVRRGRLTAQEIAFTFSVSVEDIIRIVKEFKDENTQG